MVSDAEVLDGELVSDEEYRRLTSQKAQAIERYRGYRRDAVTVYRGARTAVTHQRTKTVVRHALAYPVAGAGVVARRWRDAHGAGRFERQMRAAEAAGDQEALRYWQEAAETAKQHRHDRAMDWARLPRLVGKAALVTTVGLAGLLLVLGIILAVNSGELRGRARADLGGAGRGGVRGVVLHRLRRAAAVGGDGGRGVLPVLAGPHPRGDAPLARHHHGGRPVVGT